MVRIPAPGVEIGSVEDVGVGQQSYIRAEGPDLGATGRQLQELGQNMAALGQQVVAARRDQALHDAEVAYREFERELYDPETGLMYRQGVDAMNLTNLVQERFEAFRAELVGRYGAAQIGQSGVRALEAYLGGAEHRLWRTAAQREAAQLRAAQRGGGGGGGGGGARPRGDRTVAGATGFPNAPILYDIMADELLAAAATGDEERVAQLTTLLASTVTTEFEGAEPAYVERATMYRAERVLGPALDHLTGRDPRAAAELVGTYAEEGLVSTAFADERIRTLEPLVIEQTGREIADAALATTLTPSGELPAYDPTRAAAAPPPAPAAVGPTRAAAAAMDAGAAPATALAIPVEVPAAGGVPVAPPPAGLPADASPEMVAFAEGRYAESLWRGALRRYEHNPIIAAVALEAGFDVADGVAGGAAAPAPEVVEAAGERLRAGGLDIRLLIDPEDAALILADFDAAEDMLSGIPDARVRAAAAAHLAEQLAARERALEGAREELQGRLYDAIDAAFTEGGTPLSEAQLNAVLQSGDVARIMGTDTADVYQYFRARRAGITPENEGRVVGWLQLMAEGNPQEFARIPLSDYRGAMERATFERFTALQAEIVGGGGSAGIAVTASELRANIATELGMLPGAAERAALETALMAWIDGYRANSPGGLAPTALQQRQAAQRFMADDIVNRIDPVGTWLATSGMTLAEFAQEGINAGLDSILAGTVTLNVPRADGSAEARTFTEAEMRRVVAVFTQETGAPPNPLQLVTALAASASDMTINPLIAQPPVGMGSLFTAFDERRRAGQVRVAAAAATPRDVAVAEAAGRTRDAEALAAAVDTAAAADTDYALSARGNPLADAVAAIRLGRPAAGSAARLPTRGTRPPPEPMPAAPTTSRARLDTRPRPAPTGDLIAP